MTNLTDFMTSAEKSRVFFLLRLRNHEGIWLESIGTSISFTGKTERALQAHKREIADAFVTEARDHFGVDLDIDLIQGGRHGEKC